MGLAVDNGNSELAEERYSNHRIRGISLLILSLGGIILLWALAFTSEQQATADVQVRDIKITHGNNNNNNNNIFNISTIHPGMGPVPEPAQSKPDVDQAGQVCETVCSAHTSAMQENFGGNLLDAKQLLKQAKAAKTKFIDMLKVDYGEYFEPMFVDVEKTKEMGGDIRMKDVIKSIGEESLERLKRKFQIKLLEMQQKLGSKVLGTCDCTGTEPRPLKTIVADIDTENLQLDTYFSRYVWATGGHSAAAGHGNLFNESYTAYMERGLKPFLGAMGIEFEGRNYAMGGTSSRGEVSACWESIFGQDVDMFSWDFAMTDGGANYDDAVLHYGYSGLVHGNNCPAFAIFHDVDVRRTECQEKLNALGMATFKHESDPTVKGSIPDTFGKSQEEIDHMPELLRYAKCQGGWEKGDPGCSSNKYSNGICTGRHFKASWHPGFKSMALNGNTYAMFMVQTFVDAVAELPGKQLEDLKQIDDTLCRAAKNAKPDWMLSSKMLECEPKPVDPKHKRRRFCKDEQSKEWLALNASLPTIWAKPFCRTAKLPAQSRYLGIVTNSEKTGNLNGNFKAYGQEEYDVGIRSEDVDPQGLNGEMPLVYNVGKDRMECPVPLHVDHNDYYLARETFGRVGVTLPNKKEREHYQYDPAPMEGLISLIWFKCAWGKCPADEVRGNEAIEAGTLKIFVNGQPVTRIYRGAAQNFLVGSDGNVRWTPNGDGEYRVEFQVTEPEKFVRISSFVLY